MARRWFKGAIRRPRRITQRFRELKELEDFGVTNHMASLVMLKRGWLHRLRVRYTLFFFELLYRTLFTDITPGRLRGLQTIHFAHWTLIDLLDRTGQPTGRHALLFLSNYDGSWETYLDDFIAFLLGGVIRIWSSGEGFPWPLDGPAFKTWARECMSPWDHWYQAYPTLTVINIENNDAIRKGLLAPMRTEMEARRWLLRLGSARVRDEQLMPTPGTLESRDIQGLVFSGYRRLPHAMYVPLRVHDAAAARRWLAAIAGEVTDGRIKRKEELELERLAINIAFTHAGLERLGLPDEVLRAFPSAFQEGMAPTGMRHRSRALGDHRRQRSGELALGRPWQWNGDGDGDGDGEVTAMRASRHAADGLRADARGADGGGGGARRGVRDDVMAGECVDRIEGGFLPVPEGNGLDPKLSMEHFGFVDGVSQPVIEGTFLATKDTAAESSHLLKPGEFVLGYPAGDGTIAAGVPVDPRFDRHQMLPPAVPPQCRRTMRDFGQERDVSRLPSARTGRRGLSRLHRQDRRRQRPALSPLRRRPRRRAHRRPLARRRAADRGERAGPRHQRVHVLGRRARLLVSDRIARQARESARFAARSVERGAGVGEPSPAAAARTHRTVRRSRTTRTVTTIASAAWSSCA